MGAILTVSFRTQGGSGNRFIGVSLWRRMSCIRRLPVRVLTIGLHGLVPGERTIRTTAILLRRVPFRHPTPRTFPAIHGDSTRTTIPNDMSPPFITF